MPRFTCEECGSERRPTHVSMNSNVPQLCEQCRTGRPKRSPKFRPYTLYICVNGTVWGTYSVAEKPGTPYTRSTGVKDNPFSTYRVFRIDPQEELDKALAKFKSKGIGEKIENPRARVQLITLYLDNNERIYQEAFFFTVGNKLKVGWFDPDDFQARSENDSIYLRVEGVPQEKPYSVCYEDTRGKVPAGTLYINACSEGEAKRKAGQKLEELKDNAYSFRKAFFSSNPIVIIKIQRMQYQA